MENKLPERHPTRLRYHDYSKPGAYFITICTEGRKCVLSEIHGNPTVGEGFPLPRLTAYGEIIRQYIEQTSNKYPWVSIDHYVIMPNHVHLILTIRARGGRGDPSPTVAAVIGWLKFQTTKDINKLSGSPGRKIFQRSYFDHVIRDKDDYETRVKYIVENPMRWYYNDPAEGDY